jgi:hypothetical protein
MEKYSKYPGEKEILIFPHVVFQIMSVSIDDSLYTINLKAVTYMDKKDPE